jgi:hypothetical protein
MRQFPGYKETAFDDFLHQVRKALEIGNVTEKIIFVPDTNVVRRHYYTNFFRKTFVVNPKPAWLNVSRLAILEIENSYNRNSTSADKQSRQHDTANKNETKLFEARKEMRLNIYAMSEILKMLGEGAEMLTLVDKELISQAVSGSHSADLWIRREILEDKDKLQGEADDLEKKGEGPATVYDYFFMTCDRMNALCAAAEGIDSLYISRIEEPEIVLAKGHYANLTELLIELTVAFGDCRCVSKYSSGAEATIQLSSWWPEKSLSEWKDRIVMIDSP